MSLWSMQTVPLNVRVSENRRAGQNRSTMKPRVGQVRYYLFSFFVFPYC